MSKYKIPRWRAENRKCLIFLSLPLADRTEEEIRMDILGMKERAKEMFPEDELDFIESQIDEEPPEGCRPSVYFLARKIELASYADLVIFNEKWKESRDCVVLKTVADKYQIKSIVEGDSDG